MEVIAEGAAVNCFCLTQFGRPSGATVNFPACSFPIGRIRLTQQGTNQLTRTGTKNGGTDSVGCSKLIVRGRMGSSPAPPVQISKSLSKILNLLIRAALYFTSWESTSLLKIWSQKLPGNCVCVSDHEFCACL